VDTVEKLISNIKVSHLACENNNQLTQWKRKISNNASLVEGIKLAAFLSLLIGIFNFSR
tara:strand:+ start:830 stop:1006 length:177 start_codon:yes stop_codon:yes gene_type:complete